MILGLWDLFYTTVFLVPHFVILIVNKLTDYCLFLYTLNVYALSNHFLPNDPKKARTKLLNKSEITEWPQNFLASPPMISGLWDVFYTTVFLVPHFVILIVNKLTDYFCF